MQEKPLFLADPKIAKNTTFTSILLKTSFPPPPQQQSKIAMYTGKHSWSLPFKIKNDIKVAIFQDKILHNTVIFQLIFISLNPKYVIKLSMFD